MVETRDTLSDVDRCRGECRLLTWWWLSDYGDEGRDAGSDSSSHIDGRRRGWKVWVQSLENSGDL